MRDKPKTAKNDKGRGESQYKAVPIKHIFPEDQRMIFANHMTIQHTNEGEFTISFFEIQQPLVIGGTVEKEKRWAEIEFAEAKCLARIVVAAARMPNLIGALITNYETYERDTGKAPETITEEPGDKKHAS